MSTTTVDTPAVSTPATGALGLSRKRVAKNAASQIVTYALSGASKALVAVLVARTLGPHGLGVFSLSWTIAGTMAFFAVFGLDYKLIREMARSRDVAELEAALPLACLLSVIFGGIVAGVPVIAGAHSDVVMAMAAAACFIAISSPVVIFRASFHARERMELETLTLAVEGGVGIACVIGALTLGLGVAGAIGAFAVGRVANLITSFVLYRRLWGRLHVRFVPRRWPAMLRASFPIGVSYCFTALYMRFDIIMMAILRPAREVGLYSAASVIILTVPILATSLNGSLYPILSRADGAHSPELKKVFDATARVLLLIGIPTAVGLWFLAGPVTTLVYGEKFGPAAWALATMAWMLPLRFLNNLLGTTLMATDRPGRRTMAVSAAAVANLGANVILIPTFGFVGAVYSTLGTEVVLTGALLWGLRPLRPAFARPVIEGSVIAGLMLAVLSAVQGNVITRVATGGAFAVALIALVLRLSAGRAPATGLVSHRASQTSGLSEMQVARNKHDREASIPDALAVAGAVAGEVA